MESFLYELEDGEIIEVHQAWNGHLVAYREGTNDRAELLMSQADIDGMNDAAEETKWHGQSARSWMLRAQVAEWSKPIPEFNAAIAAE